MFGRVGERIQMTTQRTLHGQQVLGHDSIGVLPFVSMVVSSFFVAHSDILKVLFLLPYLDVLHPFPQKNNRITNVSDMPCLYEKATGTDRAKVQRP